MIRKTSSACLSSYVTLDGSTIRELMHPEAHGNANQSLAEALVAPGGTTARHHHVVSEELYHVIQGAGLMTLDDVTFPLRQGDTVCIEPGRRHSLANTGTEDLRVLCCCSPAYSHRDTVLDTESEE